eukprot:TRINITY_DN2451_c0_g1_i1.p1 TRINITY_DN2451_c0_g1~~TRINITY_DN2451_c0_g1_i1.p1  ORF type:complete len:218 (-),score=32.58 TRINITY_DN2451_c0_g1_i1:140-793(-)
MSDFATGDLLPKLALSLNPSPLDVAKKVVPKKIDKLFPFILGSETFKVISIGAAIAIVGFGVYLWLSGSESGSKEDFDDESYSKEPHKSFSFIPIKQFRKLNGEEQRDYFSWLCSKHHMDRATLEPRYDVTNECMVCLYRTPDVLFPECGHQIVCRVCDSSLLLNSLFQRKVFEKVPQDLLLNEVGLSTLIQLLSPTLYNCPICDKGVRSRLYSPKC